jgi:hypothetical protein
LELMNMMPQLPLQGDPNLWVDADRATSDEEESGETRAKAGTGWRHIGHPLRYSKKLVKREYHDGAGLCSPGRWAFSQRRLPENSTLDSVLRELLSFLTDWLAANKLTTKGLMIQAACGKLAQIPWSDSELHALRLRIQSILTRGGYPIKSNPKDVPQIIQLRLLQALLAAGSDPESYVLDWYALGSLWLGVDQRLPRAPAIFERKVHWLL